MQLDNFVIDADIALLGINIWHHLHLGFKGH